MNKIAFFISALMLSIAVDAQLKLSMGTTHGCYIQSEKLFCFGSGDSGQLGQGKDDFSDNPIEIKAAGAVTTVDMHGSTIGDNNTCVTTKAGKVLCWGSNTYGILGQDTDEVYKDNKPNEIAGINNAKMIAVGYGHACVLQEKNIVSCWGANGYGQLGDFSESKSITPIQIKNLPNNISQIYAGHSHNCVIADGKLYCWGANNGGQMGNGTKSDDAQTKPVLVDVPGVVTKADLFGDATCAATDKGAYCWGQSDNLADIFGQGSNLRKVVSEEEANNGRSLKPLQVRELAGPVEDIVLKRADACALVKGAMRCWGSRLSPNANSYEEGATPCANSTIYSPAGFAQLISIAGTNTTMCGVQKNNKIKCWTVESACSFGKVLPVKKAFFMN